MFAEAGAGTAEPVGSFRSQRYARIAMEICIAEVDRVLGIESVSILATFSNQSVS